jgi:cell division protein FtsQ
MSPRIARIAAWMIALALVATPIIAALNGWLADERWPIRRLVVQGRFVHVDEVSIRAAVAPQAGKGFFAIELDDVRAAVEALPWVERAEVRKHWPDRIDVRVEERTAIAYWGESRLLSERGDLFAASFARVPEDLPRLDGPDSRAGEVWERHRAARARLQAIGLDLVATRINQRGAWTLTSAEGAEIVLGRERMDARLERFAAALARLPSEERRRIERADLRFANGFAVVWRAPVLPEPAPAPTSEPGEMNEPQV